MPQASFGFFGIGVESTPGTGVPPTKFLPVKDVDFPIETEFIDIREIRGSRQAYQTFDGPLRSSFDFTAAFYPAGAMGVILKGLYGAVSTAAAGASATAKVHTFADAAVLPSLSLERSDARTSGAALIHQRLVGAKIESVGFSCAFGEDVEVSVSGQALKFPEDPAAHPGSYTYPAMNPFIFTGAKINIDDVANNYFKSIDFEFTNTLERQEALRGTRESYAMFEGGMECTVSATLVFADLSFYNKLRDSTQFELEVVFEGDIADAATTPDTFYNATFTFPRVKVSNFGIPMTAGEVMEADVEFMVAFDNATQKLCDIKMTNLDVAGTYDT
jgi:hypothetical protein